MLYFASSIVTSVDKEAREEDVDELRDELAADLEELDAERDRLIESTRRLGTDYVPEDDDFVDDVDEDERLTPEEVEEEIADIYEEFNERKALRQDAFDAFLKIEPKQLVPDEALYREMRLNYRDYFTGGMGAEAVRDLLEAMDLEAVAEELREVIATGKGQKRAKAIKRLKVVDAFLKSTNKPTDMILDVIPVIPPDLRPMVQLDGGRFATSDLKRSVPPRHQPQQPPEAPAGLGRSRDHRQQREAHAAGGRRQPVRQRPPRIAPSRARATVP